jgi:thiosulfate/3-mercaptopyruvate sulfurtransferase
MEPIVDYQWLIEHRDDPAMKIVVVHVGTLISGPDPFGTFTAAHLPGARYVSLEDDLAAGGAPTVGRHPLPTAGAFCAALARRGIGNDATVVAEDGRGGAFASRLVWMLRIVGQPAALLDGVPAEAFTESGPVETQPDDRTIVEWPRGATADADEVAQFISNGGTVIDSREAPRFRGETEPIDAIAGHIPGAINLPFADNLRDGRFVAQVELRARFALVPADPSTIVYCGSGVTACHNALAIEATGRPLPRVYVGSWSGWSTDPAFMHRIATD